MSNPMYSPPPGGQPPMGGGPMVNGQTIMIMGIVSIFCFGIVLGPIAWVQGNAALKTLDTYGDPTNQRSPVTTGRLCGMIGTLARVSPHSGSSSTSSPLSRASRAASGTRMASHRRRRPHRDTKTPDAFCKCRAFLRVASFGV